MTGGASPKKEAPQETASGPSPSITSAKPAKAAATATKTDAPPASSTTTGSKTTRTALGRWVSSPGDPLMCPFCGKDVAIINGLTTVHEAGMIIDVLPARCPGSEQYPRLAESDARLLWNGQRNERYARDEGHAITDDDVLTIDIRRQAGDACCKGTRIPYDAVAGPIFAGDSVEAAVRDFGISRKMALVCCWYYVQQSTRTVHSKRTKHDREVLARWGAWSEQAYNILAGWTAKGPCPDPPGP